MVKEFRNTFTSTIAYSFGQNEDGELGLNDTEDRQCPTILDFCKENDIVDIACGNRLTVVLTANGHIYTCGYNEDGQCGVGTNTNVPKLTLVSSLAEKGIQIRRIFSGNGSEYFAAVSITGELYTIGYSEPGHLGLDNRALVTEPSVVAELLGVAEIADVACNIAHTIIRATNGMLYACGENDKGQLGIPDVLECDIPKPIPFFSNRRVLAISCGEDHTIASLESGGLVTFGNNKHGQLGIGKQSNAVLTPTTVVFHPVQANDASPIKNNCNLRPIHSQRPQGIVLREKNQIIPSNSVLIFPKVACGSNHTVVVSEEGTVYAFGSNEFGQLGLGHARNTYHAEILGDLLKERIEDVACGSNHTLVVSDDGKVYSFGKNEFGNLGIGTQNNRYTPQIISSLRAQRVQKVAAGCNHSLCLVENATSHNVSRCLNGPQALAQDLRHLVNNAMHSDVTFIVEEKKVFAHSLLLSARCEPMKKMLDGRMCDGSLSEINIPERSYAVFLAFMEYLYTGNVELLTQFSRGNGNKERNSESESTNLLINMSDHTEFILELLLISDQYLILKLRKDCENLILQLMSVENVPLILQNAHLRNAFEFKKRCLNFMLNHFAAVIATDAFTALPLELLQEVLRTASNLGVVIPK